MNVFRCIKQKKKCFSEKIESGGQLEKFLICESISTNFFKKIQDVVTERFQPKTAFNACVLGGFIEKYVGKNLRVKKHEIPK